MFIRRTVFEIFDLKDAVTLKTGLGVVKDIVNVTIRFTAYDFRLTTVLCRVLTEILNVEKYRDLEIPVKGQSRSLKVVPFHRLSMVSY